MHGGKGLCVWFPFKLCSRITWGTDSSAGKMCDWKAIWNTDAGSSPQCGKGFISQSQLPMKTLLPCTYSPCVQPHASTPVCTFKIPNAGSHVTVWTHENNNNNNKEEFVQHLSTAQGGSTGHFTVTLTTHIHTQTHMYACTHIHTDTCQHSCEKV